MRCYEQESDLGAYAYFSARQRIESSEDDDLSIMTCSRIRLPRKHKSPSILDCTLLVKGIEDELLDGFCHIVLCSIFCYWRKYKSRMYAVKREVSNSSNGRDIFPYDTMIESIDFQISSPDRPQIRAYV